MEQKINSYAEAFFLLAQEENRTQEYLTALYEICAVLKENPEYSVFLSSYSVSKEKRIEAVESAFSGRLPERAVSFLCILCEKRKVNEIEEITAEYEKMYFAQENISKAIITGAYPFDEEQKKKVKSQLEKLCGHRVIAEFYVDKTLLGGVKAEIDGKIIDSSVRNQLNKLREVMDR